MDIGILAPSPVGFAVGGAEHLWLGLQRYLNEETSHHCELFKFPSHGRDLTEILRSYLEPSRFDLRHFDAVLTGKDPAWFIEHVNHRVYMLHRLRGLYDTYHFFNEPDTEKHASPAARKALRELVKASRENCGPIEVLKIIEGLLKDIDAGKLDERTLRFPGPFARELVHCLDGIALSPTRIQRYAAISRTVAKRAHYFPEGAKVAVAYPPPRLSGFQCKRPEHFFTVSRLDSAKRIDLIIREYRNVASDVNLFIGGTGPALNELRAIAEGDDRIVFLGKLTDNQILDYYARSIAVPFVPYDEDYGLITVEAMMSSKPVITVADSGGVTELVKHGENGWCVPNKEGALAQAFDEALKDRRRTAELGVTAASSVTNITWEEVATVLLGKQVQPKNQSTAKTSKAGRDLPKLVLATTMGIYPPRGGGQSRVYHLFANLAQQFDVTAICLVAASEAYSDKVISPNFREIRIPKSEEHEAAEAARSKEVDWVPITDIVAGELLHLTPRFEDVLSSLADGATAVITSGPYLIDAVTRAMPKTPLFFEAQNLEIELKRDILPPNAAGRKLLETVSRLETKSWHDAAMVFACTGRDLSSLQAEYGPTKASLIEVPNGYSAEETKFTPPTERALLAESLHPAMRKSALFLASWHGPNLTAIETIIEIAPLFEDVRFLLVGSACLAFENRALPENVVLLGIVEDEEKSLLLASATVALNPMTEGSGSNLKMLDYFGAGIPVISTSFGARGIDAEPGTHFIAAEIEELPLALSEFFAVGNQHAELVSRAHELAVSAYSWDVIGSDFLLKVQKLLNPDKKVRKRS
jgi:glycosyltransferase involved in cell wall biosynthesis